MVKVEKFDTKVAGHRKSRTTKISCQISNVIFKVHGCPRVVLSDLGLRLAALRVCWFTIMSVFLVWR